MECFTSDYNQGVVCINRQIREDFLEKSKADFVDDGEQMRIRLRCPMESCRLQRRVNNLPGKLNFCPSPCERKEIIDSEIDCPVDHSAHTSDNCLLCSNCNCRNVASNNVKCCEIRDEPPPPIMRTRGSLCSQFSKGRMHAESISKEKCPGNTNGYSSKQECCIGKNMGAKCNCPTYQNPNYHPVRKCRICEHSQKSSTKCGSREMCCCECKYEGNEQPNSISSCQQTNGFHQPSNVKTVCWCKEGCNIFVKPKLSLDFRSNRK